MKNYNIPFEVALLCGVVKDPGYKIFDKFYETMLTACRSYRVSFRDVLALMTSGCSFEDALTCIVNKRGTGAGKEYILQRQLCYGRYMLYKCRICDRLVLLPSSVKCTLAHSDICLKFEWMV